MRLTLKETPEQNQLIQAMGSKNMTVALEAQEAFAKFIGPVVQQLLKKAGTAASIYTDAPYNADTDNPSYPLDLYYNEGPGLVQVWSQNIAGGLPSSELSGFSELKIATYPLNSAVSFSKRYARKARLDIIAKAVERMAQEMLVKTELNQWSVILKALAEATSTYSSQANLKHILPAATANSFVLADLNNILTLIKRINSAFDGGTSSEPYSRGITDLYISPEVMGQIRAFAYNPVDTSANNTKQNIPEALRTEIYRSGGMQSIYGINLVEMNEFGDGKKYNVLFDAFTSGKNVPGSNGGAWQNTDQILVGLDNTRGAFIRPIAKDSDTGSTFVAQVDDQWNLARLDKAGFYGGVEMGSVCIDARASICLAV